MNKVRQPLLSSFADSPVASRVVASAADIAFVVDRDGIIVEVSLGDSFDPHPAWHLLVGKRWSETVLPDSQPKVEQLLKEARTGAVTRSREINQKAEGLGEVPFRFTAVLLDDQLRVILMGRDQRALATLQQRMISSQQSMEREFSRLQQVDTRYRVLFHVSLEAVVVADLAGGKVLEANPAAASLMGEPVKVLQSKTLQDVIEPTSWADVQALLSALEAGARTSDIRVCLRDQKPRQVNLSAVSFRQSGSPLVLIRFWSGEGLSTPQGARATRMLTLLDALPDGFVVTDVEQRILSANVAFCELVQQTNENQVIGKPLERWLGRPGVDMNIMMANLREHGAVRNFATIVRGSFGPPQEGLVTAVSALDGKVPCLGFTVRTVSSRLTPGPTSSLKPRSIDQLRELVGRVPLKQLVRESTDLIERLCIEAALDVSGNNRASAAQLLGLSRQGLYSKLRRHGLAEFEPT